LDYLRVRCGWCIANNHDRCVVGIEMGRAPTSYMWHCRCACQEVRTQCVLCGRDGVETAHGHCVDVASCDAERARIVRQHQRRSA